MVRATLLSILALIYMSLVHDSFAIKLNSQSDEDNMSVSELVQQKFKGKIKVKRMKDSKDVAQLIIKEPSSANDFISYEGSK